MNINKLAQCVMALSHIHYLFGSWASKKLENLMFLSVRGVVHSWGGGGAGTDNNFRVHEWHIVINTNT